jgi:hypothetical protein
MTTATNAAKAVIGDIDAFIEHLDRNAVTTEQRSIALGLWMRTRSTGSVERINNELLLADITFGSVDSSDCLDCLRAMQIEMQKLDSLFTQLRGRVHPLPHSP